MGTQHVRFDRIGGRMYYTIVDEDGHEVAHYADLTEAATAALGHNLEQLRRRSLANLDKVA